MINNVLDYLYDSGSKYPDKAAVRDDKTMLTYRELIKSARCIASGLMTYVNRGEPVCVYMDKSCAALATFMGAVMAGAFYVMLDTSQPSDRINSIIDTLGARVLITDEKNLKKREKLAKTDNTLLFEELEQSGCDMAAIEAVKSAHIDTDPLYGIFTSGSTGVPKGVIVNHRSVIDFIENFTELFGITSKDVIGNQAPFDFDVSVKDIYSVLKCGATLQIIPKMMFSFPTKLLDYLDETNVTTLVWAVSALCIVTALNGFDYKVPGSINKVIFSGEVMPVKHLAKWQQAYPDAMFVNVYGPTEITCNCTYYIVDRKFEPDETLPIGRPFPNERILLLDDKNRLVTDKMPGVTGEICVSGTAVTLGYYNNKTRTDEAFVQNPLNNSYNEIIYRTGDLGFYNDCGELCFSGRKDFQIKHNGHRIELGEIDMAVNAVEGVARACCIYDENASRITVYYEGSADKKTITREIMKKLPKFMLPEEFINVASMPLTKNGKIDRKNLVEFYK